MWALLLEISIVAGASRVSAQERREPPPEAVEFYRTGREHFTAGRYREAITDLERALTLDPGSATLLYNLARVHELLGELDPAIEHYRTYLQLLPPTEAEERRRIGETLQRLEGARGQVTVAPPDRPPPEWDDETAPLWVTERGVADLPFWIASAATVALLVGGGVTGVLALDRESTAETFVLGSDGTIEERDAIANEADNFALATDVLLFAALAGGITAALLYGLRTRTYESFPGGDATAAPFVSTDGTAAIAGLRGVL